MTMELEDRIRTWVDDQVAGVQPVTVDEVVDRRAAPTVHHRSVEDRRRWLAPSVAAAAVLVAGALAFTVISAGDRGLEKIRVASDQEPGPETAETRAVGDSDPDGDGWQTFVEPTFGWTWEQPVAWTAQSERDYCGGFGMSGTLITNSAQRYSHPMSENGCSTRWVLPNPLPGGFVGLSLVSMDDTMELLGDFPTEETGFPLELQDLRPMDPDELALAERLFEGSVPPARSLVINHEERRYVVSTYEGSDVSTEDVAALERLVGSIEPTDLAEADPITFARLPDGAVRVATAPDALPDAESVLYDLGPAPAADGPGRDSSISVTTKTRRAGLETLREDLDRDEAPAGAGGIDVRPERARIQVRGVDAVHDRVTWQGDEISTVKFFEYDNFAVVVTAHNVDDALLYELIEGLTLVAVGGPSD